MEINEKDNNLKSLNLDISYRSDRADITSDFYIPCLTNSVYYKRAVGYFTSGGIELALRGIVGFIQNRGVMQLIASPFLNEEDINAINQGYEDRKIITERSILASLDSILRDLSKNSIECLTWMIANNCLDIQLAISKQDCKGLYHEKIGIFIDQKGNRVAFTGSSNETKGGLLNNFESIDVYWSWNDPQGRTIRKENDFNRMWDNNTNNVEIINFPDAAKNKLIKLAPKQAPGVLEDENYRKFYDLGAFKHLVFPRCPGDIKLYSYQKEALANWFENNGQGIFCMATGTGKTITALYGCAKIAERFKKDKKSFLTIIVCPYKHLIKQWSKESRAFGIKPIECYDSVHSWKEKLQIERDLLKTQIPWFTCAIVTYDTLRSDLFQNILNSLSCEKLIIADEVHNAGASQTRKAMPENVMFRMGLSATPERFRDDEGTKSIYDYFKKEVVKVELSDAINKYHTLTPYYYYPVIVHLSSEEQETYYEITKKISQLSSYEDESDDDTPIKYLLIQRSRLLAGAINKLDILKDLLMPLRETTHNLIYCGDSRIEYSPAAEDLRQIEEVQRILGNELKMRVSTYTHLDSMEERARLQEQFENGSLQALVAIKCLDEGVDIPLTKRAFILASSTNPRQFIQRRGRVLRKAKGKEFAEIYDFIVVPASKTNDDRIFNIDRKLIRKELSRVLEFSKIAKNGPEASLKLLPLKEFYNLLDL